MVADLDRLRRLNEALGHERADLVLAALGSRLAAAFPPGALLARVGEDEFAVLAHAAIERPDEIIREALEQPLRVAGFDIFPTLSIGAVSVEGGAEAPEAAELLRRAELAVESAKAGGRGGAAAYGRSLESDGLSRLALESDLRGAISRGEIVPFYQPVVRLSNGAIAGFEALARWRHPRRGVIAPDEFLPLLAEMGLLVDLGAHMMARGGLPAGRLAPGPPRRRRDQRQRQPVGGRDRPAEPGAGRRPADPRRPACPRARSSWRSPRATSCATRTAPRWC